MITGLHHVAMIFGDETLYDRTVKFYQDVLNFALEGIYTVPGKKLTMLFRDGFRLEMILAEIEDSASTGRFVHIALNCESPEAVDLLYKRCIDAGCTSDSAPGNMTLEPYISEGKLNPAREAMLLHNVFVIGFAGEIIEFLAKR